MASLESKLLDGKAVGYCSDSEGEDDSGWKVARDDDDHQANVMRQMGPTGNTGAKGVMADFRDFREQVKEQREARGRAVMQQAQRGMLQGSKEDRERAQAEAEDDEEDNSLEGLRARRLRELKKVMQGRIAEVTEKTQFTQAIDASINTLLGVIIYEPGNDACEHLTHVVKVLATEHPQTKFVRARSTVLEMSKRFTEMALPTLQFYYNGSLIGNFVQLTSLLGQDYSVDKLKEFLRRSHIDLMRNCYAVESEDEDYSDCDD